MNEWISGILHVVTQQCGDDMETVINCSYVVTWTAHTSQLWGPWTSMCSLQGYNYLAHVGCGLWGYSCDACKLVTQALFGKPLHRGTQCCFWGTALCAMHMCLWTDHLAYHHSSLCILHTSPPFPLCSSYSHSWFSNPCLGRLWTRRWTWKFHFTFFLGMVSSASPPPVWQDNPYITYHIITNQSQLLWVPIIWGSSFKMVGYM
jgi:hypothetical protein